MGVVVRTRTPIVSRRRVIDLLLARGPLSRAELARLTHLNKPTISTIVAHLIDEGIVAEIGAGASTGGRKPILLTVRPASRLVVGVEIDAAGCRFLLAGLHGEPLASVELPLDDTRVETVVDCIESGIDSLCQGQDRATLLGCGVAVPGLVDPARETVDSVSRLGWEGVPLRTILEARLRAPVMITDRGKAAALGELWVHGKERADDLIYLYLGRGVGGAIVLGREIHWGASYIAGEIGHVTVDPEGPLCGCGNRGCLEAVVSTAAILDRARRRLAAGGGGALVCLKAGDLPELDGIAAIGAAAAAGDPLALELVGDAARWLGTAIAGLINVLNPTLVVLGGPTAEWGHVLIEAIERELDNRTLPLARRPVRVLVGKARHQAAPLGAAALVLKQAGEIMASPMPLVTAVGSVA